MKRTPVIAIVMHGSRTTEAPSHEETERYLPGNYVPLLSVGPMRFIAGVDSAGWTWHDYVRPRLWSGLFVALRVKDPDLLARLVNEGPTTTPTNNDVLGWILGTGAVYDVDPE